MKTKLIKIFKIKEVHIYKNFNIQLMDRNILSEPGNHIIGPNFLSQKRRLNTNLKENLILKKMAPLEENALDYDKISLLYRNIFSFNWDEEKIVKSKYCPSKIKHLKFSGKYQSSLILVLHLFKLFSFPFKYLYLL